MPKSRPATPSPASPLLLLVILLLLAATLFAAYHFWHQPPAAPATSQPANLISENRIIFAGMPRSTAPQSTFTILKNSAYIVGYSESRKDPLWSAYRVIHLDHPYLLERPKGEFLTDFRTTAQVTHHDFTGSHYDRGHMTPNSAIARCYGAQAQLETFRLSNICPQAPALNQKVWEHLEKDELDYADRFSEVWVIDGPVFSDLNGGTTNTLRAGISVPAAFYKILLEDHTGVPRAFAVIMPQSVKGTELPSQFTTSIATIEKQTALEFFPDLDPATRQSLESQTAPQW